MPKAGAPTIEGLIRKLNTYLPNGSEALVRKAYDVANQAHSGQTRFSGEPYIWHCLAAADILADMGMDAPTVAAGLLHDVAEDTPVNVEELRQTFGDEIARLVEGVTKLTRLEARSPEDAEAESLRKMFLAMAEDIRVVLIKLADRLHNMRTLGSLPPARRKHIAQETLEIFAPLANRLGMWQIKAELEDLALRHLEPDRFEEIRRLLNQRKVQRQAYINRVIDILKQKLAEEGIQGDITGRPKHIYSIYRKMQRKGVGFDQIYDVHAMRIIVPEVRDCYAALGIVHAMWRPIPGEFDDYIASPKENLYQSLHTAVVGPEGRPLEIQIRTPEMHQVAEYGIAAHWRYKEQRKPRDASLEEKIRWLRQLMEWRREISSAEEFVTSLKTDVFQDQVYVFTPKGDIIDLPAGATPIDFAYHIHTDIGHRCRGAKVNGRMVPLDYQLKTGDQVEIITAKHGNPSRDWLNPHLGFVNTSRAREKIRQWFRRQERDENIAEGREVLDKELRRLGLERESYEEIAKLFKYEKVDDFLAAIGAGDINPQHISTRIAESQEVEEELALPEVAPPRPLAVEGVTVTGVGDLLTRVAQCCNPLPDDDVIGFVTRGRGITIHRRDCPNMLHADKNRKIEIRWGSDNHQTYPVLIRVMAYDRPGLVRDIADIVAGEGVNMAAASAITNKKDHTAVVTATLEVRSMNQLSRILNKVDRLPNVVEARRQVG